MRFLHFIFSHSIFIACCAVALCMQTNLVFNSAINTDVLLLVFFSTLGGYNFYWLLSKYYFTKHRLPFQFFKQNISFVLLLVFSGFVSAYAVFQLTYIYVEVILAAVFTLIYTLPLWPFTFAKKLQKSAFLKSLLLASTWAYVTVILPVSANGYENTAEVILVFLKRFFFMLLLCIIFDMRDASSDKMNGLHSLATDVHPQKLHRIIFAVFVAYLLCSILHYVQFNMLGILVGNILSIFSVALVFFGSLKKRQYLFYYFLVDGLMILSAVFTFIATVIMS